MNSFDKVTQSPGQVYDYINGHFGLPGLIVAGVMIVLAVVGVCIAFDRGRR